MMVVMAHPGGLGKNPFLAGTLALASSSMKILDPRHFPLGTWNLSWVQETLTCGSHICSWAQPSCLSSPLKGQRPALDSCWDPTREKQRVLRRFLSLASSKANQVSGAPPRSR